MECDPVAKTMAENLPAVLELPVRQFPDADARLMLAYARGDSAAFDALYARYRGPLYRYFLRQCRRPEQAEELYQETWMRVVRARAGYRADAKFATWLFLIAHNLLVDAHRRDGRWVLESLEEEPAGGQHEDPARRSEAGEKLRRFRQLLEALPPEQREVFLLKEEGGLGLDEIARLLAISFEAAKSRLRYAVGKLRAGLGEHETGD